MMHNDGVINTEQYVRLLEKVLKMKKPSLPYGLYCTLKYKLSLLYISQKSNKELVASFLRGELTGTSTYLIKDKAILMESYLTNFPDHNLEKCFYEYLGKVGGGKIASRISSLQKQEQPFKEKMALVKKMVEHL